MKQQNQLQLAILAAGLLFSACKKIQETNPTATTISATSSQDDLVQTPAGLLPRSHVHPIENGYAIMHKGSHLYKIERQSRNVIEDYGEVDSPAVKSVVGYVPSASVSRPNTSTEMAPLGSTNGGWATFAYWENTGSNLIDSFQTNWTVPNIPGTPTDSQLIYLFNALADVNNVDIIQPVLQFGYNGTFSGNGGWVIDNWYIYGGVGFYNPNFIDVSPGTPLEGLILYTGGTYTYSSFFINPTTGLAYDNAVYVVEGDEYEVNTIPAVPEQVYTFETLETYHNTGDGFNNGVLNPSDYPAGQNYVAMDDILAWLGSAGSNPAWTADNNNTPNGENTNITPDINNSTNGGGAVFIYWHPAPTINNAQGIELTTTSTSYTITAYPNTQVNVELNASATRFGKPSGSTTSNLTINTPGITFSGGGTNVSVTNGTIFPTLTVPSSGSITVSGYYTTTVSPPALKFAGVSVY